MNSYKNWLLILYILYTNSKNDQNRMLYSMTDDESDQDEDFSDDNNFEYEELVSDAFIWYVSYKY